MKRLLLISLLLLIPIGTVIAEESKVLGVSPALIEKALYGKELIFRRQYDKATQLFKEIEKEYPVSPTGISGQLAIWQTRMLEYDDLRFKNQYMALEKRYKSFSTKHLRTENVAPWDLFVYGAIDGMIGFFRTREERWLSALSNAMHATRMLKQLKHLEPNFLDMDLGFGAYTYWRSVVTQQIKILPFFSDKRKEGIAMVEKVAQRGTYAKDLALGNLVFIYGNEDDYNKAIQSADKLLAIYPENIIIRILKGRVLIWSKKYDAAISLFKEIYQMDPLNNKALFYQGVAVAKKKDYAVAKPLFDQYLNVEKDPWGRAMGLYYLGLIAETEKDYPTARGYYEKSINVHKLKAAKKRLSKLPANK